MKTRRDFIKISTLGLGGIAAAAGLSRIAMGSSVVDDLLKLGSAGGDNLKRYPTYCEVCFWKCAGWTYTDDKGKILKVIGNDEDPHCYGRLCPRGTGGIGMYYDEDRLKKPLIRVKGADADTFREATWEEALDLVASKMKEVAQKYGPESFALFKHGGPGVHFEHLMSAYGSDTSAEPAFAQCRGPRDIGWKATYGGWAGSPEPTDIRDTKCLVLIGSHIGENMHNSQVQEMSDAIDRGATIITVDPRFSTAASKSKYWLPIKPATDNALLLAWIHVVINEELYNKKYVEKYTTGFAELRKHVESMTPEWAYGITTIDPELIRTTARAMAAAAPAVIVHPGRHASWYGDDAQRTRAMAILNALFGSVGNRGGFYFKQEFKLPKFPAPAYPEPKWGWKETLQGKFPLASTGVTNELIRASIPGQTGEYQVRAWFVAGTNLPISIPDKKSLQEALQAIEFLVVVDTMPMDITGYADVILPECTYLERYDQIRSSTSRIPNIALRMPATEPLYETKPAWWIAKQLGERLGLHDFYNYNDFSEVLDWQLKQVGSSLEEMKKTGIKFFPEKATSLYLEPDQDYVFPTASGKIELYSAELESLGFDPMPVYTAHEEPSEGFYRLIYGRAPMHTFSRTANNPYLHDLMKENNVWVNPKVADLLGLKKDQMVWLKNQDGVISTFPVKVRVTERIRWDSVYMVHGYGQTNPKLRNAYGIGASDTELITKVKLDPTMGGTGMRGNFVTFIKENPWKEAAI